MGVLCVSFQRQKSSLYSTFRQYSSTFYENIGRPKFICAPMVGHSYLPYRMLVRENGADLTFTQMMNVKQFSAKNVLTKFTDWHLRRDDKEIQLDRPLIAQLAGHDPFLLSKFGRSIQHQVSAIDLNLGCPQDIARRGKYGAFLLPNKILVQEILSKLVKDLECPVTAKIRIQANIQDTLDLVKIIEECGVSMLTVHGRTVVDNKQFCGSCNWDAIRLVKQSLLDRGSTLPVIANGGIESYETAQECLKSTLCDGVMSSEGILENPRIFSEKGDFEFRNNYAQSQLILARQYVKYVQDYGATGESEIDYASMKSHMFKMLYRYLKGSKNVDLIQFLGSNSVTPDSMIEFLDKIEERVSHFDYNTEKCIEGGVVFPNTWYYRYRNATTSLVENVDG